MDKGKARTAKFTGWFCIGMSFVLLAIYILKDAGGRDPSPALIVVAMAALVIGGIRLAGAKKLAQG